MTQAHAALAEELANRGVDTVFGVLSGGIDRIVRELIDVHGVRYVSARHEQGAIGMADGYARSTGRVGVSVIGGGPGLTNAATALTEARLARSPVLAIIGDTPAHAKWDPVRLDHSALLAQLFASEPISVSATGLRRDIAFAYRQLALRRAPVACNVPLDVLTLPAGPAPAHSMAPAGRLGAASQQDLAQILALIDHSHRPLVLAGRGAVESGARNALVALAERIGALLATTLLIRGWFDGEEFAAGFCGGFADDDTRQLLNQADVVLAFGAGLNQYTLAHGEIFASAALVQVGADADDLGLRRTPDVGLVGDARVVASQLAACAGTATRWRTRETAHAISGIDPWRGVDLADPPGYANPYAVVRLLDSFTPAERLVGCDIGLFQGVPGAYLRPSPHAPAMFPAWSYGAVGAGLAVATGAAIGRPALFPIHAVGDGGFMASMNDLDTIVRTGVPMLVVVFDDGGFGAERHIYRQRGENSSAADTPTPDLAALARGVGMTAHSIRSTIDLERTLPTLHWDRPTLLHVLVDPGRLDHPEMDRAMKGW